MTSTAVEPVTARLPARRMTPADMAWMAAVIDMKGAVITKKNKMRATPQYVLYVSIKDTRIAVRMSVLTGTAPEQHPAPGPEKFTRRACSEHCPVPHVHVEENPWNMPQVTRWSVTGIALAVVLVNLAPYMSTYEDHKGTVAEVLANTAWTGQGSGAVKATVARLEQLGWKIPPLIARQLKEAA